MNPQDWLHPAHLAVLVCRPALPMDSADVLAFARRIWEGSDYLPEVWEEWLADPEGLLAVAEYGGRAVGCGKLTRLSQDDWWLEGLRVDPGFQGRGIASHMHAYLHQRWQTLRQGVLRLATSSRNEIVHHLCERDGFERIGEYQVYAAAPLSGAGDAAEAGFQALEPDDLPEAVAFALRSGSIRLAYSLVDLGWRWAPASADHLEHLLRGSTAYWWGDRQGLLALDDERDDAGVRIPALRLVACEPPALVDCLLDYRRLAAALGYAKCGWLAPRHAEVAPALQAAGMAPDWESSLFIYEKRPNSPVV